MKRDALDPAAQAQEIGGAIAQPCRAACDGMDELQRLRFWGALAAYALNMAEASVGADGREAIVQTLRNVPASRARAEAAA